MFSENQGHKIFKMALFISQTTLISSDIEYVFQEQAF